jgi:hypothetical protein
MLRRFYQAGHRTDKDTAKCPESLRPLPVLPPFGGDVYRLLRGHYSSVIATTNSCAKPDWLSSPSTIRLV